MNMNTNTIKKAVNAGLIITAVICGIGTFVAMFTDGYEWTTIRGMSILARIGAILLFVAAAVRVFVALTAKDTKIGAAIAVAIFGVLAFVGQFIISPFINMDNIFDCADAMSGSSSTGYILLAASSIALLVFGIVGLVKKNKV